jgi:hypothetical protein
MNTDSILGAILFANAAVFASFAAIVIAIAVLVVNNLIYKYWKPLQILKFDYSPYEVAKPIEPQLETKEVDHERTKQSSGPKKDRASTAGNQ